MLRGANEYMLDEMERALHDSLCVIKRIIESNSLVAGGGAVETALSIYLEGVATAMGSRERTYDFVVYSPNYALAVDLICLYAHRTLRNIMI